MNLSCNNWQGVAGLVEQARRPKIIFETLKDVWRCRMLFHTPTYATGEMALTFAIVLCTIEAIILQFAKKVKLNFYASIFRSKICRTAVNLHV